MADLIKVLSPPFQKAVKVAVGTGDGWLMHWGMLDENGWVADTECDIDSVLIEWPFVQESVTYDDLVGAGFFVV